MKQLLVSLYAFLLIGSGHIVGDVTQKRQAPPNQNLEKPNPAVQDWYTEWKALEKKAIAAKSPVVIWLSYDSPYIRKTLREFYHFKARHPRHFGGGVGVMIAVPRRRADGEWRLFTDVIVSGKHWLPADRCSVDRIRSEYARSAGHSRKTAGQTRQRPTAYSPALMFGGACPT